MTTDVDTWAARLAADVGCGTDAEEGLLGEQARQRALAESGRRWMDVAILRANAHAIMVADDPTEPGPLILPKHYDPNDALVQEAARRLGVSLRGAITEETT